MAEPQRGRIDGGASETILSTIPPDLDLYTIPARSSTSSAHSFDAIFVGLVQIRATDC